MSPGPTDVDDDVPDLVFARPRPPRRDDGTGPRSWQRWYYYDEIPNDALLGDDEHRKLQFLVATIEKAVE